MNKGKISVGRYLLATAIPTAFVIISLVFYIGKLNQNITSTQHALQGQNAIQHLFHAALALKNIRGMRQFQFADIKSYAGDISESQQIFEDRINHLIKQQLASDFTIRDSLINILHQSQQLNQQITNTANRAKALKQFNAYSEQINTLYNVSLMVVSQSSLILESSLDAYYMVDIAVKQLPLMIEHLGQVRGLAINVLLNNTNKQQSELDIHYHAIALKTILHNLLKGQHTLDSSIYNIQSTEFERLAADFQSYLKKTSLEEVNANVLSYANMLFAEGTTLVEFSTEIFIHVTANLNTLIENRMQSLYQQRRITISIGTLTILLIVFFISSFYRLNRQALYSVLLAKKETEEAEKQQRTILEKMIDGVITIDEEGIIYSINPAGEHIFGYAADDLIGRNVKMLMPSPYQEEHDDYLKDYITTGQAKVIGIGRQVTGLHKNEIGRAHV